ncbi:MAG: DUF3987 domain-containing protein [Deltaproteobacteria bacterium]|nr:DUF3987 domain-containing protein [Deltaproteobacteria bacterium]
MSGRHFKDWLKKYLEYTAHSEAPDIFHFWTGVSTIAGALRRRVWIDQRYFQWTPNFYIFFVAPPGVVSKSTTMGIGMKLLREIEGVHFGPDAVTWQALMQSLADASELVTMPDGLMYPMSCITVAASELGTFFNPQDREMVDVLVSLWDGQVSTFRKSTKTQGHDVIENPWLNIIGCTTPAWVAGNFPEYMIGGGFTSRSVFVYAERKRQFVAYPSQVIESEQHIMDAEMLVDDLDRIAQMRGEFSLSKGAVSWGTQWYKEHWENRPRHMASEQYSGYIARKQTHIHKLAMVLSAAQRDELVIYESDLIAANTLVTALEKDMIKVFDQVGTKENAEQMKEVLTLIRAAKEIDRQKVWQMMMYKFRSHDEFEMCLSGLINSGYITQKSDGTKLILRSNSERQANKNS